MRVPMPGWGPGAPGAPASPAAAPANPAAAKKKLSYKDQRELEQLPTRIEQLETDIAASTAAMQDPGFYRQDATAQQQANTALAALQVELDAAYARWEALDA